MVDESTFKVNILEIRLSSELARTTISLCLSKDGEAFPISGFPRYLGSNVLQNERPRKKEEYAAEQESSQVAAKGRCTEDNDDDDKASIKVSMGSSTPDLSSQLSSSSENLPPHSPEEDMPFWARCSHVSLPNSLHDSVELQGTMSSNTETVISSHCDSPTDSALDSFSDASEIMVSAQSGNINAQTRHEINRHPAQTRHSTGTSAEGFSAERSVQRVQTGEHLTKLDSRIQQSIFRDGMRARDVTSAPHPSIWDDRASGHQFPGNPPSYAAFVSDSQVETHTTTNFDDEIMQRDLDEDSELCAMVDDMMEEGIFEFTQKEGLNSSCILTKQASTLHPLGISVPTKSVSNLVTQSATSPRSFKNIAYPLRHDLESIGRGVHDGSPTLYHSISSHDMQLNQVPIPRFEPCGWESAHGIKKPPPVITDVTEEELFQIAKMRSIELC